MSDNVQLPEAMDQGNTLTELMTNMKEAIELAIECRIFVAMTGFRSRSTC